MKALQFLLLLLLCSSISAQSNFNIRGTVEDTLSNPLISSTVLLMTKSDSTLVEFTRSELDGSFVFRKIPAGEYLVKTTYIAYIPRTVDASSDGKNIDLGIIKMPELAAELMEVVIKAAKAPIKMRGDTIEYDASTFQVPEGSSVEELLRRLPGIEIDQDGGIQADGLDVDRVTVDGKSFFGSDPKAATKNLPAEGISKVQVFDTKTEEDKIAGSTGMAESKTMNLELKEEFKKGMFGRVTGGIGTESRAELKGNINRFNEKIQFSLVGVANNTGRNGLSWDDYQDFMGSNSFNFDDDGDYGFGGGSGMRFFRFGGSSGNSIENSIQSVFFNNSNQGGFPENYNGGINFNYDHKKTQLSSIYYYNQVALDRLTQSTRQNFLPTATISNASENVNMDFSGGHRGEITLDQEIDSLHSFKIEFKGAYIDEINETNNSVSLSRDGELTSDSEFENLRQTHGYLLNGGVFFRKKFQKAGRRFGANVSYLTTELDKDEDQNQAQQFYTGGTTIDSTASIIRLNEDNEDKTLFKVNAIFVEPLSKVLFSRVFYNYSNRVESGDREVNELEDDIFIRNDFLSRNYENTIQLNRVGTSLRYSDKGMNISVGAAYQQFDLLGFYTGTGQDPINGEVDRQFRNWLPYFDFNFSPKRGTYMNFGYRLDATEPGIENLQPIVNNSNPLFVFEGNPELTPELAHSANARLRTYYAISQIRLGIRGGYTYYENNIITKEQVDRNLITFSTPVNFEGGNRWDIRGDFSFPIIKGKLKASTNMSTTIGNSYAIVNDFVNKTRSMGYYPSANITFTPNKKVSLFASGNWNIVDTRYEINTSQDQVNTNNSYSISCDAELRWKTFINTSFDYRTFNNDRFGVSQQIPILNASVYKQFLPGNKLEVRLSLYDTFNQNRNVSQFASGNSVQESRTNALGRYVMVSLSYNIKGLKTGLDKGGRWH